MIKVDETIFSDSKYLVYDLIETKQNKLPEFWNTNYWLVSTQNIHLQTIFSWKSEKCVLFCQRFYGKLSFFWGFFAFFFRHRPPYKCCILRSLTPRLYKLEGNYLQEARTCVCRRGRSHWPCPCSSWTSTEKDSTYWATSLIFQYFADLHLARLRGWAWSRWRRPRCPTCQARTSLFRQSPSLPSQYCLFSAGIVTSYQWWMMRTAVKEDCALTVSHVSVSYHKW